MTAPSETLEAWDGDVCSCAWCETFSATFALGREPICTGCALDNREATIEALRARVALLEAELAAQAAERFTP